MTSLITSLLACSLVTVGTLTLVRGANGGVGVNFAKLLDGTCYSMYDLTPNVSVLRLVVVVE